jgi:hypothetical protein
VPAVCRLRPKFRRRRATRLLIEITFLLRTVSQTAFAMLYGAPSQVIYALGSVDNPLS